MAVGIVLIIVGFVLLFLVFPFHVLLGIIAIILGILDLFFTGRGTVYGRAGYTGTRRYWY